MKLCPTCNTVYRDEVGTCTNEASTTISITELPAGARLGAYKIIKVLGAGGMGFVYEAQHEALRRRCAIKFLRPEFANNAGIVSRFLQEARAVNVISHDNIVSIFDYSEGGSAGVYFVMEFLEGEDFAELLNRTGPLPMPLLLHIFEQLIPALVAAHEKQIVHRDLKPANVFLLRRDSDPYHVKLLDFGIAKLRGELSGKAMTVAGDVMGTPQFMSPEQINGVLALDERADIWALGVMLYKAATAIAPFRGDGFADIAKLVLNTTPPPPSKAGDGFDFPQGFDEAVMRCLERDPAQRWQKASELLTALENIRIKAGIAEDAYLGSVAASNAAAPSTAEQSMMAQSLPMFQGASDGPPAASKPPASSNKASSKRWLPVAVGAILIAGAGTVYIVTRGSNKKASTPAVAAATNQGSATVGSAASKPPLATPPQPVGAVETALRSGDQALALDAIAALDAVGGPAAEALLVEALALGPEVRLRAARSLMLNRATSAAGKIRSTLDNAGPKPRVELAACAFTLGDQAVASLLRRALEDPALRAPAARALVASLDPAVATAAARVLTEIAADAPPGRDAWLTANTGLAQHGDAAAIALLQDEAQQTDSGRALAARIALATIHHADGLPLLQKAANDATFTRRGDAALAALRLQGSVDTAWLTTALSSADPEERRLAVAVAARAHVEAQLETLRTLAQNDPNRAVQLTAAAALTAFKKDDH